jgi:hypothetical protein
MGRTVAAHIDRARVANELQRWRRHLFGNHRDEGDADGSGRGRHGNRYDGAGRRPFFLVYMPERIKVVVVMDGRTMPMLTVLCVVGDVVHVKRERLDLQRAQGQHDEKGEAASHTRSVFHGPTCVNGSTLRQSYFDHDGATEHPHSTREGNVAGLVRREFNVYWLF